jgi:hypothetical protein
MNRLTITTATPDGCLVCGDQRRLQVEVSDFGIIGIFNCPGCVEEQPIRQFMAPLMDYVKRPTPPQVIA